MTDEPISPSEDDRRALLAVYSSAQLQYPGVAVASVAALLAELVVFFDPSYASIIPHGLFLALTIPTLIFIELTVNGYLLERKAVLMVLREPLPTHAELLKKATELASFKASAISSKDGLTALDAYYTFLVNENPNLITRFMLKGPIVVLRTLAVIFFAFFLLFFTLGI